MPPITTPFGFSSTAEDVTVGVDLSGRRAVVTGGASGIGTETARVLALCGAQVTLAVRNTVAARPVAAAIASSPGAQVSVAHLDLTDRGSVTAFVDQWRGPLHILINNAGIMALPELQRTAEGWEMQFATNHLGHFALTTGLHAALADAGDARIVSLSSSGHLFSPVVFGDIHFHFRPYDPLLAYGQSKSATALFAVGVGTQWAHDGITANAVMPGAIATNLQRHSGGLKTPPERRKSVQQGAATTLLAAASPLMEGVSGRYLEDATEAHLVTARGPDNRGVAPYAIDPESAVQLWDLSLRHLNDH
jgi:NAD(P)-dependent dehydrogenase (short-subunit alcohol dehydrogenase family)